MRIWGFTAAAALCAGLTLSSAQVQQPKVKTPAPKTPKSAPKAAADQNPPEPTISVDITRVNILFTVTDKKGRFITDLGQEDFDIAENKKQQSILQFAAESDLPLRIAVLIDTSNSITDRFRFEQQAAIRFMNSVMRPRQDLMMLTAFDSNVEMVTDLTDDMKALEAGIRSMRPGGGTSMYDAIYYAASQKLMMDQPRDKFRRAMIIISDGIDTASDHTRDQALEMAQKADTVIYAISTNITREDREGDKVLRYFTEETGGRRSSLSKRKISISRSRTSPTCCATSTTSSIHRIRWCVTAFTTRSR